MKASSDQKLVPQTSEDIHEIRWVAQEELEPYIKKTFPSVKDVLRMMLDT